MKYFFKTISILLFLSVFQISCYERCKDNQYKFRCRLEIEMAYNDTIQVYYLTKNSKGFSEEFSLKRNVKGSPEKQFIEFCLPEEPIDLRINFRENTENKKLKILSALFENQENQMFIQGEMFYLYFIENKYIKYDKKSNSYIFQSAPDDKRHSPSICARKVMKDRLVNGLRL